MAKFRKADPSPGRLPLVAVSHGEQRRVRDERSRSPLSGAAGRRLSTAAASVVRGGAPNEGFAAPTKWSPPDASPATRAT
jgi:hypothetical protein